MKTDINKIFDINIVEINDPPLSLPMEFMDVLIRIIEFNMESKNWLPITSLIFKVDRKPQGCHVCEVSIIYKNDTEYTSRNWREYVLQKNIGGIFT